MTQTDTPVTIAAAPTPLPLRLYGVARREWPLMLGMVTAGLFLGIGEQWLADLSNPLWFGIMFAWLFGVILLSALSLGAVVAHAL